jgi:hypothetical protein
MKNHGLLFVWVVTIVVGVQYNFAQNLTETDTSLLHDTTHHTTVVIAKGNSYLENVVTKIIIDSLHSKRIDVSTIDFKNLNDEVSAKCGTVVVFNAVKSSKLTRPVRKFIDKGADEYGNPASNVLICTVHGNLWNPKNATVDAVTGATKTLDPKGIALIILNRIDTVFTGNQRSGY